MKAGPANRLTEAARNQTIDALLMTSSVVLTPAWVGFLSGAGLTGWHWTNTVQTLLLVVLLGCTFWRRHLSVPVKLWTFESTLLLVALSGLARFGVMGVTYLLLPLIPISLWFFVGRRVAVLGALGITLLFGLGAGLFLTGTWAYPRDPATDVNTPTPWVMAALALLLSSALTGVLINRLLACHRDELQREKRLLDSMRDAYAAVDLEGRITECNPAFAELLGYRSEQLLGRAIRDLTPKAEPADEERMIQEQVLQRGWSDVCELAYRHRDGSLIPVEFRAFLIRGRDGAPAGMWAILRDLRERRRAEAAARRRTAEVAALQRLTAAVSASLSLEEVAAAAAEGTRHATGADLAFVFLREGARLEPVALSPETAREQLGEIPEHRVGECLCGLAARQGAPIFSRNIHDDVRCTLAECRRAGFVSFAALPLRGGGETIGVLGLAAEEERDFSEQADYLDTVAAAVATGVHNARLFQEVRQTQADLEASRRDLARAQAISHVGNWEYRLADGRIRWSDELFRIFGLEPGALTPSYEWLIERVHPEDRARHDAYLQALLQARPGERIGTRYRLRRPDGEIRWLRVEVEMVFDPAGKPTHAFGTAQDVTTEVAARAALEESEERFRTLATHAPVGIFMTDAEGHTVYRNERSSELAGASPAELSGLGWLDHLHPDDRPVVARAWKQAVEERRPYRGEYRFLHPDGAVRWVLTVATPRQSPEGGGGYLGMQLDVTDLRAREAQYAQIFNTVDEALFVVDPDGTVIEANQAACRMHGYTRDELLGESVLRIIPEPHHPMFTDFVATLAAGGVYHGEAEGLRKDGSRFPIEVDGHPFEYAGRRLCLGVLRDVTERREGAEAFRDQVRRNETLLLTMVDGYILADTAGLIREVNPSYCQMVGYERHELIGRNIRDIEATLKPEEVSARIQEFQRAGKARFETRHRHKEGNLVDLQVSLTMVQGAEGPLVAAFVRDITRRKRAEVELQRLNEELELRVAERTRELERKNRELETFTYSVSHDLKAPLRGIDGYSRLLLEEGAEGLDEERQTFLRNIRQACEQMNELIDDLLAYSRLERRALVPVEVDLRRLLEDLIKERSGEIADRQVRLTLNVPEVSCRVDPDGLRMALRNLLDNALKFSRDLSEPAVEIAGQVAAERVKLTVRDNGVGFDMRFHDRIFQIFQRLHRAEDYPGTGVGLALVSKAMERLGGRVWAESAPREGAVFHLEFPRNG